MLIEDLTTIDAFINEKQIQPAQGKTEGNILVLGGSPGSGKNWVIENLTDVKNRYKVFDVDAILELASKMEKSKFKDSFLKYLMDLDDKILSAELIKHLEKEGILGFIKNYVNDTYQEVLRDFIHQKNLLPNSKANLLMASLYGSKPNVALNGTFRTIDTVTRDLELLNEVGYEVDGNVDYLFIINTEAEALSNANKRSATTRKVDNKFLIDARDGMIKNLLSLLDGNSPLSYTVRYIYVVFNSKSTITYYDDKKNVKDFNYIKLRLSDADKVSKLINLIKNNYA